MMMQIYRQISEWACHDEIIIQRNEIGIVHHDPS